MRAPPCFFCVGESEIGKSGNREIGKMLINDSQIIEFLTGDKSEPRKPFNANSKLVCLPFYKQYSSFVHSHLLHDSRDIVFVNYSILYLAIVASTLVRNHSKPLFNVIQVPSVRQLFIHPFHRPRYNFCPANDNICIDAPLHPPPTPL